MAERDIAARDVQLFLQDEKGKLSVSKKWHKACAKRTIGGNLSSLHLPYSLFSRRNKGDTYILNKM